MNIHARLVQPYRLASWLILFAWLINPATLHAQAAADPRPQPDFAAIDAYVAAEREALGIPGLALGIVHGDQLVHLQGFGVADEGGRAVTPQTPFYIGSVTKSFTALAALQLVEAGKLDLDAPVQRYLPWFRVADEEASRLITLRHLLSHTGGLSTQTGNRFWNAQGMEADVRQLRAMRLRRPVGQEFQYSNINYTIAGLIIEQVSGQAYGDYIQQHIFAPLAMKHSFTAGKAAQAAGLAQGHTYAWGRVIADTGIKPPGMLPVGFLMTSAEDLSHYLIAQLNGGRYAGNRVLSPEGIALLHQPVAAGLSAGSAYGLGWTIGPTNGVPTVWHNGDDTRNRAWAIMTPDSQWGIVLLANATGYQIAVGVDEIAKGVLNLVLGQQPSAPSSLRLMMQGVYWGVLLMPLLQIIGIGWGVRQGVRWQQRVAAGAVRWGRLRLGWHLLGPILPNLLIACFFLWGLPQYVGLPLATLWRLLAEFGVALITAGLIGIGWSIVRTLWVWSMLRHAHQPLLPLQAQPSAAAD